MSAIRSWRPLGIAALLPLLLTACATSHPPAPRVLPPKLPGQSAATSDSDVREAVLAPLPSDNWEAFSRNTLSAWIESTFGVAEDEDGEAVYVV